MSNEQFSKLTQLILTNPYSLKGKRLNSTQNVEKKVKII